MSICILKLKIQTLYSFYSSVSKLIPYTCVLSLHFVESKIK